MPLEDRTTPAPFTVELLSAPMGDHGNSVAHVVGGGLAINPTYDVGEEGPLAYVEAPNVTEAIKLALAGTVTVDLTPVGQPLTSYTYQPSTVGGGPPLPFRILSAMGATIPPPGSPPAPPSQTSSILARHEGYRYGLLSLRPRSTPTW